MVDDHHDVPFRLLDKHYTFTENEGARAPLPQNSTGNCIIYGDNLEPLKSLLPEFEGNVNCIYINPPSFHLIIGVCCSDTLGHLH